MAYAGYLLKIGSWAVPFKYIDPISYKTGNNREKVVDWTDYLNERHVVYTQNSQAAVSFETSKNFRLSNEDLALFTEALTAAKIDGTAYGLPDTYKVEYYDPGDDAYHSIVAALEDLEYTIWGCNNETVFYNPIKFSFSEVTDNDA